MKILMTADTIGGVWTYALELAGELHHQGVEVTLATMGDPLRPGNGGTLTPFPRSHCARARTSWNGWTTRGTTSRRRATGCCTWKTPCVRTSCTSTGTCMPPCRSRPRS